uniref:Cytochrome P450 2K1 n=1 Tax=Maylandia zebra TaxID=106582 RepID=A0A3P9BK29_9CICH
KNDKHLKGILFANGESWKELRRFALATLKDFGMGKRLTQGKILEECGYLIQVIEDHKGNAFDTALPINYATANIISSIVFGSRFDYGDPVFKNMVKRANQTICVSGSASVQVGFLTDSMNIKNLIKHLKETLEPGLCRGLVDCFLIRKQKEEVRLCQCELSNLFAAGTDTTAATLRWGLLLMAKYPHIQEQVHEELSRVVGSRQVCVDDRKNLPYTDAVIHETQRLANIVPMSVPHQTSQDVTFKGYFIKKGTIVFPLLTSVLYDESEWESPHTFNPSHFLDKKGQFVRRDAFMPFSAGRRMCLGEGLAKMELFLFFTSLIQRFRFTPPPGITEDELDLTPAVGFTTPPSSHMLCAVSRQ